MHPRLLDFGFLSIPTYGVLAATGLILGMLIIAAQARRDGLDADKTWDLGIYAILAGVLGAKVLYIIADLDHYLSHPKDVFSLATLQAGGVWYGALIGGIGVGLWYVLHYKLPLMRTIDAFAPGISFGHGIGRLGCFFAGCCYGKPTDVPWGVVFTSPQAIVVQDAEKLGLPPGLHLHPTQIYEFSAEMVIFSFLLWLSRRRQFHGQVAATYIFLYSIVRFVVEFYRGDPDRGFVFNGALSTSQFISIFMVLLAGSIWIKHSQSVPAPAA